MNVIGHSWGSYVSYEIGMNVPGGVKVLVALDPAADTPLLEGGRYKGFSDPEFRFSDAADNSYAFHSSDLGNRRYALSAEYTFDVIASEGYEDEFVQNHSSEFLKGLYEHFTNEDLVKDMVTDAMREHSFAVTVFSELLARQKAGNDPTAMLFSIDNLRSDEDEFLKNDGAEGIFYVYPMKKRNAIGSEEGMYVWDASIFGFFGKDEQGNDLIHPRTL